MTLSLTASGSSPSSTMSETTSRPPGRSTRDISRNTADLSGTRLITQLLVTASTALSLLGPYLMGLAIDRYISTGDLAGLAQLLLVMTAAYASASLLTYLQTYVMAGVAQQAIRDIRADLFNHMQELSLRFFDQRAHGDLMSRLANDIDNINNVLNESVTQLIASVLSMPACVQVSAATVTDRGAPSTGQPLRGSSIWL